MVKFPVYNEIEDDKIYFSDYLVRDSKVFALGVTYGLALAPNPSFADQIPKVIPGVEQANAKNTSTLVQFISIAAAGGACARAAKCTEEGIKNATVKGAQKVMENGGPNVVAIVIVGCVFLAGWCVG